MVIKPTITSATLHAALGRLPDMAFTTTGATLERVVGFSQKVADKGQHSRQSLPYPTAERQPSDGIDHHEEREDRAVEIE